MTKEEIMKVRAEELKSIYSELGDLLRRYNEVRCSIVYEDFKAADRNDDTYENIFDDAAFIKAENDFIEDIIANSIEKAQRMLPKLKRIYCCAMRDVIKLESK